MKLDKQKNQFRLLLVSERREGLFCWKTKHATVLLAWTSTHRRMMKRLCRHGFRLKMGLFTSHVCAPAMYTQTQNQKEPCTQQCKRHGTCKTRKTLPFAWTWNLRQVLVWVDAQLWLRSGQVLQNLNMNNKNVFILILIEHVLKMQTSRCKNDACHVYVST
jgi:hypothetical protein